MRPPPEFGPSVFEFRLQLREQVPSIDVREQQAHAVVLFRTEQNVATFGQRKMIVGGVEKKILKIRIIVLIDFVPLVFSCGNLNLVARNVFITTCAGNSSLPSWGTARLPPATQANQTQLYCLQALS